MLLRRSALMLLLIVSATLAAPFLQVTAPSDTDTVVSGEVFRIRYKAAFLDVGNTVTLKLKWSTFVLETIYSYTVVSQMNVDQYHDWTAPTGMDNDETYRIELSVSGTQNYSVLSDPFKILSPHVKITFPTDSGTLQIGGNYDITWESFGQGSNVTIRIWNPISSQEIVNTSTPNDGVYNWTVPDVPESDTWAIRITGSSEMDGVLFSINQDPYIEIIFPSNGDTLHVGTRYTLLWDSREITGNVEIQFIDLSTYQEIPEMTFVTENDGSEFYMIPLDMEPDTYAIRIEKNFGLGEIYNDYSRIVIEPSQPPEEHLIAHWDFNQTGSVLEDRENNNDGTIYGGATWVEGVEGTALAFDGVDDYVVVPINTTTLLDTGVPIHISLWFNTSIMETAEIFGGIPGGGADFQARMHADGRVSVRLYAGDIAYSNDDLADGQWHHIAWGTDGTDGYYYVDGIRQSGSPTIGTRYRETELTFGARKDPAEDFFTGLIDQAKIYDCALPEVMITDEYYSLAPPVSVIEPVTHSVRNVEKAHQIYDLRGRLVGSFTKMPQRMASTKYISDERANNLVHLR